MHVAAQKRVFGNSVKIRVRPEDYHLRRCTGGYGEPGTRPVISADKAAAHNAAPPTKIKSQSKMLMARHFVSVIIGTVLPGSIVTGSFPSQRSACTKFKGSILVKSIPGCLDRLGFCKRIA
jgi:hypothetical protein